MEMTRGEGQISRFASHCGLRKIVGDSLVGTVRAGRIPLKLARVDKSFQFLSQDRLLAAIF